MLELGLALAIFVIITALYARICVLSKIMLQDSVILHQALSIACNSAERVRAGLQSMGIYKEEQYTINISQQPFFVINQAKTGLKQINIYVSWLSKLTRKKRSIKLTMAMYDDSKQ